jgi:hypothetical protein
VKGRLPTLDKAGSCHYQGLLLSFAEALGKEKLLTDIAVETHFL